MTASSSKIPRLPTSAQPIISRLRVRITKGWLITLMRITKSLQRTISICSIRLINLAGHRRLYQRVSSGRNRTRRIPRTFGQRDLVSTPEFAISTIERGDLAFGNSQPIYPTDSRNGVQHITAPRPGFLLCYILPLTVQMANRPSPMEEFAHGDTT
jgi:hypothetical protein